MPVRHFKNQRNSPISTYRYDSLYQLIESYGRESIPSNQGPGLPELQTLAHEGNSGYRRQMLTSALSNRSLLKTEMGEPDFDTSFDANGNLQWLAPGANRLQWDSRNQLHQVVQVLRDNAQGQRLRKVITRKTRSLAARSD